MYLDSGVPITYRAENARKIRASTINLKLLHKMLLVPPSYDERFKINVKMEKKRK